MSLMNSTEESLQRATPMWQSSLAAPGQPFELAQFRRAPALEKQTLDGALASGDVKLIALAQDWLRDTGQAVPVEPVARAVTTSQAAAGDAAEAPNPTRYLRGVR